MLSIIATIYNRINNFERFAKGLAKLNGVIDYEFCLSCFEPTMHYQEILDHTLVPNIVCEIQEKFSISKGKNVAYSKSKGDVILFFDTDIEFETVAPILEMINLSKTGKAVFPIIYRWYINGYDLHNDPQQLYGNWASHCFGLCLFHRTQAEQLSDEYCGPWNEKYIRYGGEDNDLYRRAQKITEVVRRNFALYHIWHERPSEDMDLPLL